MKLDVGCGGNIQFKSTLLPRADINCDIRKPLRKIPNFIKCDAHHLPFVSNSFERVYLYDVLEHLESPFRTLKEAFRVLEYDGTLELGTPNTSWILRIARAAKRGFYSPDPDHIAVWGLPELKNLFAKVGFKQIDIEYVTYSDNPHKLIEKLLLKLCPFKALKHRQLLALGVKK